MSLSPVALLALITLLVSVAALGLAVVAVRRTVSAASTASTASAGGAALSDPMTAPGAAADSSPLPQDVLGLRQEVAALRLEVRGALRNLALVRYDAFDDMGGHLSWSAALLDEAGDGVVLTSIHGRADARTYAKAVAGWASEQQLSPEELEAIEEARGSRGG